MVTNKILTLERRRSIFGLGLISGESTESIQTSKKLFKQLRTLVVEVWALIYMKEKMLTDEQKEINDLNFSVGEHEYHQFMEFHRDYVSKIEMKVPWHKRPK